MREALRLPAFRRLLSAYALNELALYFGTVALASLVYRATGSPLGAATFFLCAQFVPGLIAPLVVARLQRLPAQRVLPPLYACEALAYLVLAWLAGHFAFAAVIAVVLLDGTCAVTARPLARTAGVTVTRPAGLLAQGNVLTNIAFSVCFMAGPGIGGAVVAAGGTREALLVVTGLFVVIAITLATARHLPAPHTAGGEGSRRLRAAATYARSQPAIRALLAIQAIGLLFFTVSTPVEVVLAQHNLRAGAAGFGGIVAGWGAGAIVGSVAYARWHRLPAYILIGCSAAAVGAGMLVMGAAPTIAVAIAGGAICGVGNGVEATAARTALQEQTEDAWMPLMMSLSDSLQQIVPGAGILLGGGLTALFGARMALVVGGIGCLAVAVAARIALAPVLSRAPWAGHDAAAGGGEPTPAAAGTNPK